MVNVCEYKCNICNKIYKTYQTLWNHNKKFHSNINKHSNHTDQHYNKHSNQSNQQSKQPNQHSNHQPINVNLICKYCNKKFSYIQSRWVHEKKCVLKYNIPTNNIITNINTVNIVNANTINNKIIINKLGNENVLHLTKAEVMIIFNKELESITTMIELLNFNERLPENHSFCTTNLESGYISVYNTEKQASEKDRKKYMFDKILDNTIDKIQLLYDHYKNKFDSKRRKEIEDNLYNIRKIKIAFMNDKIKKEMFKKINLISYNNKDIIKKTWDKKHKLRPELTFEEDLELPPTDSENEYSDDELSDDELSSDDIRVIQV